MDLASKNCLLILGFILLAFVLSITPKAQELIGVASVTDGDTLSIHDQKIRLHGIDAPESRQECSIDGSRYRCGQQAAFALSDRIGREPITCRKTDVDRYNRIIAICFKGSEDLNEWMVSEGWAVAYRRYSEDYIENENIAREQGKGIWAGRFVLPEEWRRGTRLESNENSADLGTCRIKGNINSNGVRIYHVPEGRWYDRTKIDTSKGERYFCTEDDAVSAGWRRSSQ